MLRNFAYGGLALVGGAITGIVISSWATPPGPALVAPEVQVATVSQPAMTFASTSSGIANDTHDCSPWEVSDVAMEAALNEMIRRGWRPPTQAEVVGYGVNPLEPGASVPVSGPAPVSPDGAGAAEEPGQFPLDPIPPSPEGAPPPLTAPSLTAPPSAPAIPVDEPAPPSN
jgi:hypothetical protein